MACPWKPVRRQYSVPPLHIEFDTEPLLSYPPPPLNMVFAPEYEIASPTFDPGVQPITSVAAKIPKPSGEVGRPGRGGYKLIDALGWDAKQYESIVAKVANVAAQHLISKPNNILSRQPKEEVQKVVKVYPFLSQYETNWPVRDMLFVHLKNKAQRASYTERDHSYVVEVISLPHSDGNAHRTFRSYNVSFTEAHTSRRVHKWQAQDRGAGWP
ncbi:hypothetical protein FOMPIDRAFT_1020848 [Fomitopsis schrenkii]|uniref:Uncharacterized protein n=1 Tax=Fomitopsis schrenkii TaxID=2126942 RepID=S8F1H3_FOMSC|nr:hypothetical protein FOMPIDRAFT_1020848 [Fomitopsis schrenkii]